MAQKPIAITVVGILILSLLAAISLTHQAFAQKKPTQLTLKYSADIRDESYQVTGQLTSEGQGLDGATITFTTSMLNNPSAEILSPTQTNSYGSYTVTGSLSDLNQKLSHSATIIAHYAGDSEHMPAQSKADLNEVTCTHPMNCPPVVGKPLQ